MQLSRLTVTITVTKNIKRKRKEDYAIEYT